MRACAKLDAVTSELTTWARAVADERGQAIPSGPDPIATCASWLAEHVEWLRHRQESTEAFDTFAAAARVLVGLVDGPGERRWLGQCGDDCTTDLYARVGATFAECGTCGTRHDVADRRAWLDETARGYSYTAAEIEQAYGIRANTIRVWHHRGRVQSSGEVDGRPLFQLGAVLDLAAQDAARRATLESRRQRKEAAA